MLWYNKCENLYKESVYNFWYTIRNYCNFYPGEGHQQLNATHGALFTTAFNFDLSIISSLGQCFLPTL